MGFSKSFPSKKKILKKSIPHFTFSTQKFYYRPIFMLCQNLLNIFSIKTWYSFSYLTFWKILTISNNLAHKELIWFKMRNVGQYVYCNHHKFWNWPYIFNQADFSIRPKTQHKNVIILRMKRAFRWNKKHFPSILGEFHWSK